MSHKGRSDNNMVLPRLCSALNRTKIVGLDCKLKVWELRHGHPFKG